MEKISHSQLHGQIDAKLDRLLDGQSVLFELMNPMKDLVSKHEEAVGNLKEVSTKASNGMSVALSSLAMVLAQMIFQVYGVFKK